MFDNYEVGELLGVYFAPVNPVDFGVFNRKGLVDECLFLRKEHKRQKIWFYSLRHQCLVWYTYYSLTHPFTAKPLSIVDLETL